MFLSRGLYGLTPMEMSEELLLKFCYAEQQRCADEARKFKTPAAKAKRAKKKDKNGLAKEAKLVMRMLSDAGITPAEYLRMKEEGKFD